MCDLTVYKQYTRVMVFLKTHVLFLRINLKDVEDVLSSCYVGMSGSLVHLDTRQVDNL